MSDKPVIRIRNGLPVLADIARLAVANGIPKPFASLASAMEKQRKPGLKVLLMMRVKTDQHQELQLAALLEEHLPGFHAISGSMYGRRAIFLCRSES